MKWLTSLAVMLLVDTPSTTTAVELSEAKPEAPTSLATLLTESEDDLTGSEDDEDKKKGGKKGRKGRGRRGKKGGRRGKKGGRSGRDSDSDSEGDSDSGSDFSCEENEDYARKNMKRCKNKMAQVEADSLWAFGSDSEWDSYA